MNLAERVAASAADARQTTEALLAWLVPGRHIRYAGATGSRYGVARVSDQGYGHGWDFSDLFVSLCRAEGIPARQIGGWLYGAEGHVWAEVYLDGEGWLAVDPTAGTACATEHIPLWTSENGRVPLVYLDRPRIEVLEPE